MLGKLLRCNTIFASDTDVVRHYLKEKTKMEFLDFSCGWNERELKLKVSTVKCKGEAEDKVFRIKQVSQTKGAYR